MVDRKAVNGANSFQTPGVTICIPPIITDQPDVIGFSACVSPTNYIVYCIFWFANAQL